MNYDELNFEDDNGIDESIEEDFDDEFDEFAESEEKPKP